MAMFRTVWTSASVMALGVAMACDPKVADVGDEDAVDDGDGDDDDDGDDGATTGAADGGNLPGTGAGSDPVEPCDSGDDEGGESGGCPEPEPEPEPGEQHAYAIRFGDLPPIGGGGSDTGGSSTTGGDEIDPDTLLVVITTGPDDCDDPWAALACGQWSVSFSLPPGSGVGVYSLFPDLNGTSTATGPADEIGECWFGGGSLEGTVEITSTDGAIAGQITDAQSFDFDANVGFVATLCE